MSTNVIATKIITFYALTCDADGCNGTAACQTEDAEGVVPPDGWVSDGEAAYRNHYESLDLDALIRNATRPGPDKRLFVEEPCYCPAHAFDCIVCELRHGGEVCFCHACHDTGVIVPEMENCVETEIDGVYGGFLPVGAPCPYLAEPSHAGSKP